MIETHGRDHVLDKNGRAILQRLKPPVVHDLANGNSVHRDRSELCGIVLDHHVAKTI